MKPGAIPILAIAFLTASFVPIAVGDAAAPPWGPAPAAGELPGATADASPPLPVEPGLLEALDAAARPVPVVVQFHDAVPAPEALAAAGDVRVHYTFQSIPAVFAEASPTAVRALAHADDVRYIERADKAIRYLLDTATVATRAKDVWDPTHDDDLPALTGPDDTPIDGAGVGIAIIDTGVDATHPDFQSSGTLAANYLVTPAGVVDAPHASPTEPHGTAVAGVAAGTGAASGGEYAGAAPGATLYSFATKAMEGGPFNPVDQVTLFPAIAMDWILQHGADQDPPIRVVSNAWHCFNPACQEFNPDQVHIRLASDLAEAGYVVTWAAGEFNTREGHRGIVPEATNPTPGIVSAANYDDFNLGIQNGCTSDGSARGNPADPASWPDVAAPGEFITTTWPIMANDDTRVPEVRRAYNIASGTSLAAAHTAGAAALLLDANPSLTPAEVEYVLKATAVKLTDLCGLGYLNADPAHPWDGANYQAGHGLVDVYAATEQALGFAGIPGDSPEPEEVTEDFYPEDEGVRVDKRLYLASDDELSPERPVADEDTSRRYGPNDVATFTSEPLNEGLTVTGVDAAVWAATPRKPDGGIYNAISPFAMEVDVERVTPEGPAERGTVQADVAWHPALQVREKVALAPLDPPIVFEAGDRVRLHMTVQDPGAAGEQTATSHWILHWASAESPSHVGLGTTIDPVLPGGYEECRSLTYRFCAWLDVDHPNPAWSCKIHAVYRLVWTGPPGSSATLHCGTATAHCEIPADLAAEEDTCVAFTHWGGTSAINGVSLLSECTFEVPEGTPPDGYEGRCETIFDP